MDLVAVKFLDVGCIDAANIMMDDCWRYATTTGLHVAAVVCGWCVDGWRSVWRQAVVLNGLLLSPKW